MLVGITADLHLTSKKEHPERYQALEEILDSCANMHIKYLIIAGDLFDQSMQNYAEFEEIVSKGKYKNVRLLVIPGNHDQYLHDSDFVTDNITIISDTQFVAIHSQEPNFLFVPYLSESSMSEEIAKYTNQLIPNQWNLIGHGDWAASLKHYNAYESGIYMPLTNADIRNHRPKNIFLGHIHKSIDDGSLHYAGSPCGIDITETGYRRFLIYEVDKNIVTSQKVNTTKIFINETITVFPIDDELSFFKKELQKRIDAWNLTTSDKERALVRIKVQGYSTDRNRIAKCIEDMLQDYHYYDNSQPDLKNLSVSLSPDRDYISGKVINLISNLNLVNHSQVLEKEDIIMAALKTIYEK